MHVTIKVVYILYRALTCTCIRHAAVHMVYSIYDIIDHDIHGLLNSNGVEWSQNHFKNRCEINS